MQGRVHSFQSLGTVDGPGVRAVVFMQGCPLRCVCCHNPDTWDVNGGSVVEAEELFKKVYRLRAYFGREGGLTVSGGEPLMQPDFVAELFRMAHAEKINTALDTSGCVYNEGVKALLDETDLVLLDYKYTNAADYKSKCGCEKSRVDAFLEQLEAVGKRTWLRQVIIPGVNDSEESVRELYRVAGKHSCVEKVELLPFRKLCAEKYEAMGIKFPLIDTPEAKEEELALLRKMAENYS